MSYLIIIPMVILAALPLVGLIWWVFFKKAKCLHCLSESFTLMELPPLTYRLGPAAELEFALFGVSYRQCQGCERHLKWHLTRRVWVPLKPGEWEAMQRHRARHA